MKVMSGDLDTLIRTAKPTALTAGALYYVRCLLG